MADDRTEATIGCFKGAVSKGEENTGKGNKETNAPGDNGKKEPTKAEAQRRELKSLKGP